MSYFIVVNGIKPDLTGLCPINVIPAADGQSYIPKCVNDFRKLGLKGDFWFIDDGYTGTSDEFVENSMSRAWTEGTLRNTLFYQVLLRCELAGNSIFLWYGNHNTHLNLPKVTEFEEMVRQFEKEASFFYQNSKRSTDKELNNIR